MASLFFAALLVGQCTNGTCSVPSKAAPVVSYSYSYQSPTVSYSSSFTGAPCQDGSCTKQRRGLLKRLFRNR